MIVAIPIWQGRVSPVFDVAGQILLVELEHCAETSRHQAELTEEMPDRRADQVATLGADTVICGAISRSLETLLNARGVQVIARVCGGVEEILAAFCNEELHDDRFAMPGCCQRRRRQRRCRSRTRNDEP